MKKFLLILVGLFAFPNSLHALTCEAGCTLREGTEAGTYCTCSGDTSLEARHGCSHHQYYNPAKGSCEECNSDYYSCKTGHYDEKGVNGYSVTLCSSVIEGCWICYGTRTCSSCKRGYTLSNGACVKKPTCTSGQYTASDGTCQPCSNISVPNGSCLSCSSSSQCDNISCNTGYVKKGGTCVKAATCTYPLKEVTDYSGECAGCCTD